MSNPVQQATGTNTVTIAAPAAGNSLIALISGGLADSITSISGGGVTWSNAIALTGSIRDEIWYGHGSSGSGTTITLTRTGRSPGPMTANVSEWSSLNNAGPEGTPNSNSAVGSSTVTTNSTTPSSAHSLVIAIGAWTVNDYSSGPTNSFTRMTSASQTGVFIEGAYQLVTSAASYSTGWSLSAGINWVALIAAFGMPGGSTTNSNFLLLL